MENKKSENFRYESRCDCGKLLTKPTMSLISLNAHGVSLKDQGNIVTKMTIIYGAQTMCRRCKKLHNSTHVLTEKDLLAKA